MDILVNLQAFLATADAAGFSAAARELNVSTSVVAKRVTQLEARIGSPLFHRSTRQLRLTEAGQRYVHRRAGWWRMPAICCRAWARRATIWSITCASRHRPP